MADDYYALLGVKRDASEKDIRQAFRRLARRYHPDVNPNNPDAEARFKRVNEAFEVLSNRNSRRKYDRYGEQWQHADQIEAMRRHQAAGGFASGGQGGQSFSFDFGDLSDLVGRNGGPAGGRSGSIFDSLFGRGSGRRRGQDVEHHTRVTLEEAYGGATRTIEVREGEETCRICGGSGQIGSATCHACRGTGSAAPLRRIEVTVPPGVQTGTRIRVASQGAPGQGGGQAGDLYLVVEVLPHPRFERDGDDLRIEVDVPVADAALGGEVRVPTLKGRSLALTIPPGTQGGRVFRLAGQGMPRQSTAAQAARFGDLHARVCLVLPDPLTAEQRRLFEQLRDTTRDATREQAPRATGSAPAGSSR
ncbi:MAG: J domain-containing protein [Chloroflexi bacterium]|nr:J domain-containing protein [Chloroflexota bacterium]